MWRADPERRGGGRFAWLLPVLFSLLPATSLLAQARVGAMASECGAAPAPSPGDSASYGDLFPILQQLGVPAAHRLGFSGAGVRIALLDQGFDARHESLASLRVLPGGTRDFVADDAGVGPEPGDPPGSAKHGTAVWSLVGGYRPGQLVGPAFGACFLLARVDDAAADPRADEDRWVAALEWAESLGARIVVAPIPFRVFDDFAYRDDELNGDVARSTRAADEAAGRGVLVISAVGDAGPAAGTLRAPADGDSVIAVAAASADTAARFSSRGPAADGRIKPDLAAPGVSIPAASAAARNAYELRTGTAMAAALITGAAALLLEAWPDLSPMEVREALILSASRAGRPDHALGHGIPDVASAILFPRGILPDVVAGASGGVFTTLAPVFRWDAPAIHPRAGAVRYRLEIATDPQFEQVIYADTTSDTSLALRRPLRRARELWWRVVAETEVGVRHASPPAGPLQMPAWVRLDSLNRPSGMFIRTTRPRLAWSPIDAPPPLGPLEFDVQILSALTGEVVQTIARLKETAVTVPEPLAYNHPYRWRVIARAAGEVADTVESAAPFVVTSTTQPGATVLYQNFPNPFPRRDLGETSTTIWFDLARHGPVELAVYDLRGRLVRRLIPAAGCGRVELPPGLYGREGLGSDDPCVLTRWDGRDDAGREVPPGVYILRLRASGAQQTRRVLFLPNGS